MKIAILCEYLSYIGGGERVYCSWANMFAEYLGHDVTIISMEDWDKPYYKISNKVKLKSLKLRLPQFYRRPFKRKKDMILRYFSDKAAIEKHLIQNNYDVVIGIALNINLILANIKGKFIKIATEHSEYYAPSKFLRIIRNKLYSKFDALTVLSNSDLNLFSKYNPNCMVMLNPVEALTQDLEPSNLKNKLIISVGSLSPQKNQSDLIHIMALIHKEFPEWRMKIYGEGVLHEEINRQIYNLNLNGIVVLSGVTPNVPQAIREGSVFVLSSSIEGFGLVLIESMSVGVPCVSYNTSGPGMLIQDGTNGLLVPKMDRQALYLAVKSLIIDFEKRKFLGLNGLNSVQKFHPKNVADSWNTLLNDISSSK